MENKKRTIRLGFTEQNFEEGVHICQIFSSDGERHDSLVNFIVSGLKTGESTACFSENETESSLSGFFSKNGISLNQVQNDGSLILSKTEDVYFENGAFEPERMLKLLKEFYLESQRLNRSGARVIGEMNSKIEKMPGGSRLMEYESKVSLLLRQFPVTAVCQYDARDFDGSTIMDILKVHPYMIVQGSVVHNPFYIQPEQYLSDSPDQGRYDEA
jgi:hypothetical protein